jgi:hypothetical protein
VAFLRTLRSFRLQLFDSGQEVTRNASDETGSRLKEITKNNCCETRRYRLDPGLTRFPKLTTTHTGGFEPETNSKNDRFSIMDQQSSWRAFPFHSMPIITQLA